jgi:hypothetical protein
MKPILFSVPMVQAIQDDRKTQTRRVIKNKYFLQWTGEDGFTDDFIKDPDNLWAEQCPYGKPGDILWVRETWKNYEKAVGYGESFRIKNFLAYKADQNNDNIQKSSEWYEGKWKPSIFMPREAARIFLKVTNVRVERLQEITVEDAHKEGCYCLYESAIPYQSLAGKSFQSIWESLNKKRGFGWDTNPWVWVIEFEKVTPNET